MAALPADTTTDSPLTLSEQLDAMLLGWLERQVDRREPNPGLRAKAVITVTETAFGEVERFCARWEMTVERPGRGSIAVVEGPALPVEGFTEITAMYRRAR
jgi:hypothetical protein